MLRISGPQYISIFQTKNINIILLGDEHFSNAETCNECENDSKCTTILDVLKRLKKSNPMDIFLESPVVLKKYRSKLKKIIKTSNKKGWLSHVTKQYVNSLYGHEKKDSKGLRVHYGDIRLHPSLYPLQLLTSILEEKTKDDVKIALSIIDDFKGKTYFKRYFDACIKRDNYPAEMEKLFGERSHLYWYEDELTSFNGKQVHRIRKQILKLPSQLQRRLLRYYEDESRDIMEDYYMFTYKDSRREFIETDGDYDLEAGFIIREGIFKWYMLLMDIYMLARMLHYIQLGTQKNVVCFAGTYHAYNYNLFFTKYMSKNEYNHKWKFDGSYIKNEKRCVHVPENILFAS